MYINLKKRSINFKRNFKYRNYKKIDPLIYSIKLNKHQSTRLNNAARIYLQSALKLKKFYDIRDIAKKIERKNHKNISVSGILVPKKYSSVEYNLCMKEFYSLIDELGIRVNNWYAGLGARVKFGKFIPKNFSIQDSGSLHVDSTAGFSTNCFAVFYNLSGDINNNFIKFWKYKKKIKNIPFKILKEIPSVKQYRMVKEFIEPHKFKLKYNEILVIDNLIFHQTIRKANSGNRISFDNLFDPKYMYGKDEKNKIRKKDLVSKKKLLKIGSSYFYKYPHDDNNFVITGGLKFPAFKKEIKF